MLMTAAPQVLETAFAALSNFGHLVRYAQPLDPGIIRRALGADLEPIVFPNLLAFALPFPRATAAERPDPDLSLLTRFTTLSTRARLTPVWRRATRTRPRCAPSSSSPCCSRADALPHPSTGTLVHPLPHEVRIAACLNAPILAHCSLTSFPSRSLLRLFEEGHFPVDKVSKTFPVEQFDEAIAAM